MRVRDRDRVGRIAMSVAVAVVLVVILWIDIATGLWQEFVILAGVAAGLVSFVLTVLVLDRIVARSTAQRWAPVTLLALTEFLHALADDDKSEITRGTFIRGGYRLPRLLTRRASRLIYTRSAVSSSTSANASRVSSVPGQIFSRQAAIMKICSFISRTSR